MKDFKGSWKKVPVQAVMRNGAMSPAEKVVLLYLMSFEEAYPTMAAIMDATDLGEKQARKALQALSDMKVISWEPGKAGRANTYNIKDPSVWSLRKPRCRGAAYKVRTANKQSKRTETVTITKPNLRLVGG